MRLATASDAAPSTSETLNIPPGVCLKMQERAALLVLPAVSSASTPTESRDSALESTIDRVSRDGFHSLTVAVPLRLHLAGRDEPRLHVNASCQSLLTEIYGTTTRLISRLGERAQGGKEGGAREIDVRVVFLELSSPSTEDRGASDRPASGPTFEVDVFASRIAHFHQVFGPDGQESAPELSESTNAQAWLRDILTSVEPYPLSSESLQAARHVVVAVGGTFDHLHAGHRLLLSATALLLRPSQDYNQPIRRMIVGITGDELLQNKQFAEHMQTWDDRQRNVMAFLKSILLLPGESSETITTTLLDAPGPNGHAVHTTFTSAHAQVECVRISDAYGPTITDRSVTALVVSEETAQGGKAVNDRRHEKGWPPLEVLSVPVLDKQGPMQSSATLDAWAAKISSTAIRRRCAESRQH